MFKVSCRSIKWIDKSNNSWYINLIGLNSWSLYYRFLFIIYKCVVNKRNKNGALSLFAASQNGHSTVVQNLIANKVSIDQADNQWELIDRDKYRVSFTLKELTKHERCCWIASTGYMINYNGYVMEYNKYKLRIIFGNIG